MTHYCKLWREMVAHPCSCQTTEEVEDVGDAPPQSDESPTEPRIPNADVAATEPMLPVADRWGEPDGDDDADTPNEEEPQ